MLPANPTGGKQQVEAQTTERNEELQLCDVTLSERVQVPVATKHTIIKTHTQDCKNVRGNGRNSKVTPELTKLMVKKKGMKIRMSCRMWAMEVASSPGRQPTTHSTRRKWGWWRSCPSENLIWTGFLLCGEMKCTLYHPRASMNFIPSSYFGKATKKTFHPHVNAVSSIWTTDSCCYCVVRRVKALTLTGLNPYTGTWQSAQTHQFNALWERTVLPVFLRKPLENATLTLTLHCRRHTEEQRKRSVWVICSACCKVCFYK